MENLEKGKIKYFILAFSAAFLILALMVMFTTFLIHPFIPEKAEEQENTFPYLPRREDCMNFLLIGIQQKEAFPDTCMLIRFSPEKGQIPVLTLSGRTAVEYQGKTCLLGEIFQKEGGRRTADALAEYLKIPIERYGVLSLDNFEKLVKLAGNVEYTVPYNVSYTKGEMKLEISKGRQMMDGGQMGELITCQHYSGGESMRCSVASDLAAAAINQYIHLAASQRADALFKAAVNLVETDADYMDYEKRKRALIFMAELKDKPAISFPVSGAFNQGGNTYSIDKDSRELIRYVYGGEAPASVLASLSSIPK